jgi:FSR family fosmidomycin resistance protein-like MFS transporter
MGRSLSAIQNRFKQNSHGLFSYGLLIMTLTHLLTHVFTRVHTSLFPILQVEFDLSLQQLGLIAAIPPLASTLLAIPTGLLSDKLGSRWLILGSMAISAVGALLASQATTTVMLIIAVSLVYINTTVYHPAAYSFVTRMFKPRDRLRALGIHGAGGTLGVAIGPLSISLIIGVLALGWRQVYLFWFIPFVLGIVTMLPIRAEPEEDESPAIGGRQASAQVTKLLSISLVMFLAFIAVQTLATGMSSAFMALYLVDDRGMTTSQASLWIGLSVLMGVVAAPLGGFWAARFGEKRWLLIVYTLAYCCYGLAIAMPGNVAFVVFYLSYGFLSFLGMAATSAIMARLSPGKQRGLAYALFFLPGSLMGVAAPLVAASIADHWSLATIFVVSTITFFLSLLVLQFGVKFETATA